MPTPKEAIYDEHISPLMAQIIAICKACKIPLVAQFALGFEEGSDSQLLCTTTLLDKECEPTKPQEEAARILVGRC